jgi:endonuclease-3
VPDTIDELLKFHGVGRKTANIVVTIGFGKPGVAVDTYVHRISNRLG